MAFVRRSSKVSNPTSKRVKSGRPKKTKGWALASAKKTIAALPDKYQVERRKAEDWLGSIIQNMELRAGCKSITSEWGEIELEIKVSSSGRTTKVIVRSAKFPLDHFRDQIFFERHS